MINVNSSAFHMALHEAFRFMSDNDNVRITISGYNICFFICSPRPKYGYSSKFETSIKCENGIRGFLVFDYTRENARELYVKVACFADKYDVIELKKDVTDANKLIVGKGSNVRRCKNEF